MKYLRTLQELPEGEHLVILTGEVDQSGLSLRYQICENEQEFMSKLIDDKKCVGIKVLGKARLKVEYTFDIPGVESIRR